jgi:hypothetical protein
MTLSLSYLSSTLAFDSLTDADKFLTDHSAAIYTNPTFEPAPLDNKPKKTAWKAIHVPKPTPLEDRVWDAKKAHSACVLGMGKYRVVDLKGQVD